MSKLKLAIIGCGAVAERVHLPALALSDRAEAVVLVDKSLPRARELAARFGVPEVNDDYRNALGNIDAAIIAAPHHLHAPIAIDLLLNRIPVLVEKPMALSAHQCDEMIAEANLANVVLAVGLLRRFSESLKFVKHMVEAGLLGEIISFDLSEGSVYSWPLASDSMFRKEAGGVLADAGAHALDLILWWLGDYDEVQYFDDAFGGVEADCKLNLKMKNGASGSVELSRLRNLKNSCVLRGERATLEVGTKSHSSIQLKINGQEACLIGEAIRPESTGARSLVDLFRPELDDFVDAIMNNRPPSVPGSEGRRGIELIERCYAVRQPLAHPWLLSMESLPTISVKQYAF